MQKKFETIGDMISNEYFLDELEAQIRTIRTRRQTRPALTPGYHYKKDCVDTMLSEGTLKSECFCAHIGSILVKKSNLPSAQRNVIHDVCVLAMAKTFEKHPELKPDYAEKTETEK